MKRFTVSDHYRGEAWSLIAGKCQSSRCRALSLNPLCGMVRGRLSVGPGCAEASRTDMIFHEGPGLCAVPILNSTPRPVLLVFMRGGKPGADVWWCAWFRIPSLVPKAAALLFVVVLPPRERNRRPLGRSRWLPKSKVSTGVPCPSPAHFSLDRLHTGFRAECERIADS
jgi:hypothetical protein